MASTLYAYVRNDPLNYFDPAGTQGVISAQDEDEKQRQLQQEAEKKKAADAQTAQQQSTEPQKVVQPKDSPYKEDGVTLKDPVAPVTTAEKVTNSIQSRSENEIAAFEAWQAGNLELYNKYQEMANRDLRSSMELQSGKKPSEKRLASDSKSGTTSRTYQLSTARHTRESGAAGRP